MVQRLSLSKNFSSTFSYAYVTGDPNAYDIASSVNSFAKFGVPKNIEDL